MGTHPPLTLMGCRPLLRISHSIFLQIRHFLKASREMSSEPNQKEYMLILASSSIPPWTQTITHTCIPGRSKLPKFPLTHTQEGGQRWGGELPLLTPSLLDSQVTTRGSRCCCRRELRKAISCPNGYLKFSIAAISLPLSTQKHFCHQ